MSDFEVNITKNPDEKSHFHPELEILFVIEGNITASTRTQKYELKKEDVLVFNSNTPHMISSETESVIYTIHLPWEFMKKVISDRNILFDTDKIFHEISANRVQKDLKQILRELVFQYVRVPGKTRCMEESLIYQLLDCLIENYEVIGKRIDYRNCGEDDRLNYILDYIGKNYMRKISLSDLADEVYMSASSLSRMFKRETGIYFVGYVNQLRARYAAQKIIYSKENLTKIAMDCGFTNLSMFNKVFRQIYDISPSEYRNKMQSQLEEQTKDEENEEIRKKLRETFLRSEEKNSKLQENTRIEADVQISEDMKRNWCKAINIGAVSKLARANLQFHTLYLMEHLHVEYIRIWNIFSRKLQISDGSQKKKFNYDEIDQIFDFLVSNHAKLILDFGRRPDRAFRSEGQLLFEEEEYIEFQSREAWENLLKDFISHLVKRYGVSEVDSWIFEFSYIEKHAFPYYKDEDYDFFNVYWYGYSTIRNLLPSAEIGGFNGNIRNEYEDLIQLLGRCKKEKCEPDFLSFLLFPYYTDTDHYEKRSNEPDFEMNSVDLMKKLMHTVGMEKKKLYIMEWNCSVINRNILNDSTYRAAYITKILSQIGNDVDLLCLWMGSDWVSSYLDSVGISYGGGGILTKDTICKPAYYALSFFNQLGNELVLKNENMIITKKKNEYYIICHHYEKFSSNYFMKDEDRISFLDMQDIFDGDKNLQLQIELKHLPSNGIYVIKKRSINEQEGSLLAEWSNFQFDTELESADVKYIRNACYPRISMEKQEIPNDRMKIRVELRPQEVVLLHIFQNEL